MKMLRTIRFDASDDHIYEVASPGEEWAISGGAAFTGIDAQALQGKVRQAFANGFLGLGSFGRSTFVSVGEATVAQRDEALAALAAHLRDAHHVPQAMAEQAARAELDDACALAAELPIHTVLTVRRVLADGGEIEEEFRTIAAPTGDKPHAQIWSVVPDEGDDASASAVTSDGPPPAGERP
ncbi:MAG: DUF6505 family protein [Pseudomonadota bacterium]